MAEVNDLSTEGMVAENPRKFVQEVFDNPSIVLLDEQKFDIFYDRIKEETDKLVPDVSTQNGRDKIRAMAAKVTRTKTVIDNARKALTEDWRRQTNTVNAAGKVIRERLAALADDVRKPLTDWEDAEDARVERCQAVIDKMLADKVIGEDDTVESVKARGAAIWAIEIDAAEFGNLHDEAASVRDDAIATLKRAMDRLAKEEADRAELDKLRAEAAERQRIDDLRQAQREAADRMIDVYDRRRSALAADPTIQTVRMGLRLLEEGIPVDMDFGPHREAVQRAYDETFKAFETACADLEALALRLAAEEAENHAKAEAEAEVQRQIDEANARAAKAVADAKAEADRLRIAAEEKAAEEKRIADEMAAREADREHREAVKAAIAEGIALAAPKVPKATISTIVLAMVAGEIPHVRVEW